MMLRPPVAFSFFLPITIARSGYSRFDVDAKATFSKPQGNGLLMAMPPETMRFLLLAVLVLAAPLGSAQAYGPVQEPAILLEDATNDVVLGSWSNPMLSVPFQQPDADLVDLSVGEGPGALLVRLHVAALPAQVQAVGSRTSTAYFVQFAVAEEGFVLVLTGSTGDAGLGATLYQGTLEDYGNMQADLVVTTIPHASSYEVAIPRVLLSSADGAVPVRGTQATNWAAVSRFVKPMGGDAWVGDRMNYPDAAGAKVEFTMGSLSSSTLSLSSPKAYVASNGLATTYPFEVDVTNAASRSENVRLEANDLPRGWDVVLPAEEVIVGAGETRRVAILVTVPFFHQHGSVDRFDLVARGPSGRLASLDLGVIYTTIPQPAGHHDRLFVHSYVGGESGFVNTLEQDAADAGIPIAGGFPFGSANLTLPLAPQLATGLDFDLERQGTFHLVLESQVADPAVVLSGRLALVGAKSTVTLAHLVADPQPAEAQQDLVFDGRILPAQLADYVPFEPGSELRLEVQTDSSLQEAFWLAPPRLVPGSWLDLPLFDYHDDIAAVMAATSGLRVGSPQSLQRSANPGDAVVFDLDVANLLGQDREVSVRAESDVEGAGLPGVPRQVRLPAGESVQVPVTVVVPATAVHGDLVNVVVVIEEAARGSLAFARLTVVTDTSTDLRSDEVPSQPVKESPTVPLPMLAALFFAIVLGRRRSGDLR